LGLILKVSGVFVVGTVALAADEAADKTSFEKVCGHCHASTLIHEMKTQGEWSETVDNMVANGAKGTDEELDAVLRYLARNFAKVNINAAEAEEIAPVLDVSLAVAQGIVEYRMGHGSFAGIDDLKKVPGLDAAKVEARKERIAFR